MRDVSLLLGASMMLCIQPSSAGSLAVDLELVIAADSSLSMGGRKLSLQLEGYSLAFRDPELVEAIKNGPAGKIAVCYVEWGTIQRTVVPWTILTGKEDADRFATTIADASPRRGTGSTDITSAIAYSARMITENELQGARRAIDISGDGENNTIEAPDATRDLAINQGITINGLPMDAAIRRTESNSVSTDVYYREHVIGGPGAFLLKVKDVYDLKRAIKIKLLREIAAR